MSNAIPLDEQIVATLTGACTSEQASAVLADADAVLRDLTKKADAADVASLSPLATATEARKHRDRAADHRFEADRMEASVSALSARVSQLKQAESKARREAARQAALAVRDELAAEIAERYPAIVVELTRLVQRSIECDALCQANGIKETAEAIGRQVPNNFYVGGGFVMRLTDIRLPTVNGVRLAWETTMTGEWVFHGLAGVG